MESKTKCDLKSISKHNILFLQHGVTAFKTCTSDFGMKGSSPMTHFTTTSRFEHKIIVENLDMKMEMHRFLDLRDGMFWKDTSKNQRKRSFLQCRHGDHGWKKKSAERV